MGFTDGIEAAVFIGHIPADKVVLGVQKFVIAEMGENSSGPRPSTCRRATTSRRVSNL